MIPSIPQRMSAASTAKFPLTKTKIIGLFTQATLARAQGYVERAMVQDIRHNKDFSSITAEVKGSGTRSYTQDISLYNVNGHYRIEDYCSCPVGRHCKHVAAVLLTLFNQSNVPAVQESALSRWQSQLAELTQNQQSDTEYEEHLIYVLSSHDDAGVKLELRVSKLNKRGEYTKGRKVALDEFHYYQPWWLPESDKQLVALLSSTAKTRNGVSLTGDVGFLLLDKLIQTERAFWENSRLPMTWGESSPLSTQWENVDKQHKQLVVNLKCSDSWELIKTQPPTFIDLNQLQFGVIETQLSAEKIQLLQTMPKVSDEQLKPLSHSLLRHLPVNEVSLPIALNIISVTTDVKVKVCVTNLSILGQKAAQPVLHIEFMYGQYCLPSHSPRESMTLIEQSGQDIQIQRQLDTEQRAIDFLESADFYAIDALLLPSSHSGGYWTLGNLPDAINPWLNFADKILPRLSELGYVVDITPEFNLNVIEPVINVDIDEQDSHWFSLALSADIEGESVSLLPLIYQWLQQYGEPDDDASLLLPTEAGQFVRVPAAKIKPLIGTISELLTSHESERLTLPKNRAAILNELSAQDMALLNGQRMQSLAAKLQQFKAIEPLKPADNLQAQLREYQQQGLNWLGFLKDYQFGGILADDMGLGKTLQTLAFLQVQHQKTPHARTLIVCPTSLVGNWAREAQKFTPDLAVKIIHGPKRNPLLQTLSDHELVITSYPLIQRDKDYYLAQGFDHLILDEAQQIKNAKTKATQVLNQIEAKFRLCLTGTPVENHLGEIKSIFDFCLPGFLGQTRFFNQHYRNPIEKQGDNDKAKVLNQRMAPFMLRRTKAEVASELPEKTEINQLLPLEKDQRNLYESIRISMEKKVRELFAKKGLAQSQIEVLDALLKLRQACCDARLVKLEQAAIVKNNAKLDWLEQNLPEMIEEGRKILIFSQFTSMLTLIEESLADHGIAYSQLTGQTRNRQQQIDAFQEGNKSVFLISLKAGGTGLNLTAADTVIHFDPWWNPAAERQATDRAYRIGQKNPVFVYKLITEATVEEKILTMQQQKQSLADSILTEGEQTVWDGNAQALLALFSDSPILPTAQ